MGNLAISVNNLSKQYRIGVKQARYKTLRETLTNTLVTPFRRTSRFLYNKHGKVSNPDATFWALKEVSFEVKRGEVIGIIGRNGAGKSTLLKILSRITEPTEGHVNIFGRVGSLLEVGTGFHPELTGRENIYLNGAILGMKKAEISNKFDAIVEFAEIEKFIDTPVKHYSSGMYVRLAFAVAAHLESEILFVDEVLAVGDIQFQQKCLGKMEQVGKDGRTVLFVSHNMGVIGQLCDKSVLLADGRIKIFDKTALVLPHYFETSQNASDMDITVRSYVMDDTTTGEWKRGKYLAVEVSWMPGRFEPGWECDLACYTMTGIKLFAAQSQNLEGFYQKERRDHSITFFIEHIGFAEKPLRFDIGIRKRPNESYDIVLQNALVVTPANDELSSYRRDDILLNPRISCKVGKQPEKMCDWMELNKVA